MRGHIVLNYIGPNNGQGIRIYHDGLQVGSDDTKTVGTEDDSIYASVDMDELLFFSEVLCDHQIMNIINMV